MLTYTKHTLVTLLLLAPLSSLNAANSAGKIDPEIAQNIDQLMQATGLKHVIDSFPQEIEAQIKQQKINNSNAALSDEESRLLFSHFKSDTIYRDLKRHLNNKLDRKSLSTLLKMHDEPLMKRIVAAEIAASSPARQKEMTAFISELRHKAPSETRIKMIQQLDRTSMSTESVIYIMEMMMLGMNEMMLRREGEGNDAKRRAQMQEVITNTTRLIEGELRQQIIMSMHYIYRDFTDAEVMHYIEQLKRDENQHYTRTAIEGIGIVILDAFKHGMNQLLQLRNAKAA